MLRGSLLRVTGAGVAAFSANRLARESGAMLVRGQTTFFLISRQPLSIWRSYRTVQKTWSVLISIEGLAHEKAASVSRYRHPGRICRGRVERDQHRAAIRRELPPLNGDGARQADRKARESGRTARR